MEVNIREKMGDGRKTKRWKRALGKGKTRIRFYHIRFFNSQRHFILFHRATACPVSTAGSTTPGRKEGTKKGHNRRIEKGDKEDFRRE